jgi:tetratricopeptide (TPR) repeat protein
MKQLITLTAFLSFLICLSQTNEIDSLTIQLAYQKQDSSKVKTSVELIKALYGVKDYKKALLYIDQTENLSNQLQFTKGIADANYYRALIYSQRNDYYNAIDHFTKARTSYKILNDALGVAQVNNSIGLIEIRRGNYVTGLNLSLSALQIFEEQQLPNELSIAYNNLAEAYYNTHQIDQALEFNFKALSVREQLKDSSGIITTTKNIAELYSERREHRRAIEFYEKLLALIDTGKNQKLKGDILPKIGAEYLRFNDFEKATEYLVEGLKLNRDIKNDDGVLSALNAFANLNLKQNNIRLAEIQLNEAYNLAQGSDNKLELLKNYRLQKELDSTKGAFQSAFQWQSRYFKLKSELDKNVVAQIPNNISDLNIGIIKDPGQLQIQEQLDAINKSQDQNKNFKFYIYFLIAALIVALTFLIITFSKRKNDTILVEDYKYKNVQIKLQNENISNQIADLEEINKVKDRLFSIVSHDLKDSI